MKRSWVSLVSILPLSFAACGSNTTSGDCTPGAGGHTAQFVANALLVPASRTDYAYDLTGSGRTENQLGIIMGALAQQNLNPQMGVTQAIQAGSVVLLISEDSADATFSSDTCASTKVQAGVAVTTPPTAGASYMVDSSQMGGTFAGPITSSKFNSSPPATTKMPVSVQLQLPLVPMSSPLPLNVIGAHIQYTYSGGMLTGGQINGALKATDVNTVVIPKVAELLQSKIQADKGMPTSTDSSILTLFDTGGNPNGMQPGCTTSCTTTCQNPMSSDATSCTCAKANDGNIDLCEVSTNSIIKSVLAPDVQMFDSSGNYAPNPAGTTKDSLSLGLAFTAINAKF